MPSRPAPHITEATGPLPSALLPSRPDPPRPPRHTAQPRTSLRPGDPSPPLLPPVPPPRRAPSRPPLLDARLGRPPPPCWPLARPVARTMASEVARHLVSPPALRPRPGTPALPAGPAIPARSRGRRLPASRLPRVGCEAGGLCNGPKLAGAGLVAGAPLDSASKAFTSLPPYPALTSLGLEPFFPPPWSSCPLKERMRLMCSVFCPSTLVSFQSKPWEGHRGVLGHTKLFLALFTHSLVSLEFSRQLRRVEGPLVF